MVKNTTGGTGSKSLARKHQVKSSDTALRLPEDELERIACVTKMLGNGMCEVFTNDNVRLIGHIRNKFRGKQKRHNMLSTNAIILVGLREWENPSKNCDILTMYDDRHIETLRNMPTIKIAHLLELRLGNMSKSSGKHDDIDFTNEDIDDESDNVPAQHIPDFELEKIDDIDIDDI
jgi:initiation factor 1A